MADTTADPSSEQKQQQQQNAPPSLAAMVTNGGGGGGTASSRFRAAALGAMRSSQSPSPSPSVSASNNSASANGLSNEGPPPSGPLPPPPTGQTEPQAEPQSELQTDAPTPSATNGNGNSNSNSNDSSTTPTPVPLKEMNSKLIYDIARTHILTKRVLYKLSSETGYIKLRSKNQAKAGGANASGGASITTAGANGAPHTPVSATNPSAAADSKDKDGSGSIRAVAGWKEQGAIDSGKKPAPPTSQPSMFDALNGYIELIDRSGMWRNCAGVFGLMFLTYILTTMRMGIVGLAISMTYGVQWYRNSIIRYRRTVKDDLERAYERATITRTLESVGWMNEFVTRFWLMFEPSLSRMVIDQVDPILAQNTPGFLDSLRLTTFTLGTKAPRIDGVRTYSELEDRNQIVMDWHASFTPNDMTDVPAVLRENRVNPKVVLTVRVGKGFIGAGMPILVENMVFKGKMQVKLQLGPVFPHVRTADVCFLERPTIDFTLKPVGVDTFGVDIAHVPGLRTFILDMIHATIGPMFYAPNHFTVDVEQIISGAVANIPSAKGVLIIHMNSARGLPKMDTFGKADPYVRVSTVKHPEVFDRTRMIEKTLTPSWDETLKILIYSKTDTIQMDVFDWNNVGKDDKIGFVSYPMQKLLEQSETEGLTLPIMMGETERGQLSFDMAYYPVSTRNTVAANVGPDGNPLDPSAEAAAMDADTGAAGGGIDDDDDDSGVDSNTGILRLFVRSASNLAMSPALARKLCVRAEAFVNKDRVIECPEVKNTDAPSWEVGKEVFVPDRDCAVIHLVLTDTSSNRVVGKLKLKIDDALAHQSGETGSDWHDLEGHVKGKVRLNIKWRPILMDPDVASSLGQGKQLPGPPIGFVKLMFHEGRNLKNVEASTGSKSDPYVRVMVQNVIVAKTRYIANTLDPVWHETLFIPVHRVNETMALECMDWNRVEKHKTLGEAMLKVSRLLGNKTLDENGDPVFVKTEPIEMWAPLRQRSGKNKGEIRFRAAFVPAINFDDMLSEAERARGTLDMRISDGGLVLGDEVPLTAGSSASSVSSSDLEEAEIKANRAAAAAAAATPHAMRPMNTRTNGNGNGNGIVPNVPQGPGGPMNNAPQDDHNYLPESIFSGVTGPGADGLSQTLARYPRLPNINYSQFKAGVLSVATIGCRGLVRPFSGVFVNIYLNGNKQSPVIETQPSRRRGYEHIWENEFAQVAIPETKYDSLIFDLKCQPAGGGIDRDDHDEMISIGRAEFSMEELLSKKLVNTTEPLWIPLDADTGEVLVFMRFDPVEDPQLLPSESITDQGMVRVRIASASDLPAADKSGTSDPYVVALVDGVKVWESQTLKKTLNPRWNQQTEVGIRQRSKTVLTLEVFDWNQIQSHTLLGTTTIPLKDLPINDSVEKDYPLASSTMGSGRATMQLKFQFKPGYVEQHDDSTPVLLDVAHTVVKAPVTVIKGGASVVGNVVGGIFGKLGGKKTHLLGGSKRHANADSDGMPSAPPSERKLSTAAMQGMASATNMPLDDKSDAPRSQRAADGSAEHASIAPNSPRVNAAGAAGARPSSAGTNADSSNNQAATMIPMPRLSDSLDTFPSSGMLQITIESAELHDGSSSHGGIHLGSNKRNVLVTVELNHKTVHKTRVEKDVSASAATVTYPHERFSLPVLQGGSPVFNLAIKDHSSFRSDKVLAEFAYNPFSDLKNELLQTNGQTATVSSRRLDSDTASVTLSVVFTNSSTPDETFETGSIAGSILGRHSERHKRRSSAFSRKSLKQ
ncbi:Tricalbin-2 [Coemansia erecta]|uniref:Tricalbin-2 n=1 Tax=Coemansia erecta TaxID=147472 RepID=A0A9W7Y3T1_9FUNG|nr:Tricalbin-2 [Coemansia erecta]